MAFSTPPYLQSQPWQTSQNYLNGLGSMFSTRGIANDTQALNQQTWNSGSAIAAAAANQYRQRALQTGASSLGAGFAQASAMLPLYGQIAQNNLDLGKLRLQSQAQQAQIGASLAGDIGREQGQYQSTLADYFLNQQKLAQQQSQFGQTLGLQQQQLAAQTANQQQQNKLLALSLASKLPAVSGGYYTDNMGNPMSGADAATMARLKQGQNFGSDVRNTLYSFF
jgi:hypothetical protein